MLKNKAYIENATVSMVKTGCQGVLVKGNLILTAGQCISYFPSGGTVQGRNSTEEIKDKQGKIMEVLLLAIDPLIDIAVFGCIDQDEIDDEPDDFEIFCEKTKPVTLGSVENELFQSVPVNIYTHLGKWVTGTADQSSYNNPILRIQIDEIIENGSSGSPIVNDIGELVGIIHYVSFSNFSQKCSSTASSPDLALPVWIINRIINNNAE